MQATTLFVAVQWRGSLIPPVLYFAVTAPRWVRRVGGRFASPVPFGERLSVAALVARVSGGCDAPALSFHHTVALVVTVPSTKEDILQDGTRPQEEGLGAVLRAQA